MIQRTRLKMSHTNDKTLYSQFLKLNFDLLDHVDELGNVIDMLVSDCILSFVLSLPEINLEWFGLIWEETDDLIKKLNGLLSLFNALI